MGIVGPFIRAKAAGHDAEHQSLSNVKVKNEWSYTSSTLYAFTACIETLVSLLPFLRKLSIVELYVLKQYYKLLTV